MKKILITFFCSIFLVLPSNALAKTVTCSNGTFDAEININKEKISINESTNLTINSDYEYEINYKVNDKNIIEIDDTGRIYALKEGDTSIKTTITFFENNKEVGECDANITFSVVSNDSSLKSLNLEEIDISGLFKADKYDYEFKIPYKFEKINIIAEPNNSNAKITGDGRRYLNEGTNEYELVVTASDGSTTTYKITFIRESANDDVTLKNLIVEGYEISPSFNKETYKYTLNVDKDVDEIIIKGEPTYEFAKIRGNGAYLLASGENIYSVVVTAENGNEATYKIIINKNNGSSKLKNITIENYDLDFNSDIYIYNINVKSDIETLNINAEGFENDQIEIIGNEKLKFGENEIIIRVTSNDKTNTTYKIIVNKLSVEEENEIEKNNILLTILLIIFIISIIVMFGLIAIFLKRNYKGHKKNKKLNNLKNKKNKKK